MKFKLIVFDMDGVIFQHNNFWLQMHQKYSTWEKSRALEEKYLKTDTLKLAELVIKNMWGGKSAEGYFEIIENSVFNPNVEKTFAELKKRGLKTMILTSGPSDLAEFARKKLGADFVISNKLMIKNGRITGEYIWKIKFNEKGRILREFCEKNNFKLDEVACIGDNEHDISMMEECGLAIAFNSDSPALKMHCDEVVDGNDMDGVLRIIKEQL